MGETGTSFARPLQVSYSRLIYCLAKAETRVQVPLLARTFAIKYSSMHVRCNRLHIGLPNRRNGIVPRYVLMVYSFIGKDIRLSAGRVGFNSRVNRSDAPCPRRYRGIGLYPMTRGSTPWGRILAGLAQLAARLFRNQKVIGSSPIFGSAD